MGMPQALFLSLGIRWYAYEDQWRDKADKTQFIGTHNGNIVSRMMSGFG